MTRIQESRWNAGVKMLSKIKRLAKISGCNIYYDGVVLNDIEQLVITDNDIYVQDGNCNYGIMNTEFHEGLNTSMADFKKLIRSQFKLFREVKF